MSAYLMSLTGPTLVAALILLVWLLLAVMLLAGHRRLRRLDRLPIPADTVWPRVTLVLAARNEGATLGAAVPTMLALDYPDLELIAVNDRSEDDTGAVLAGLAATDPRLRVITIADLPAGWIGKCHALHTGATAATGDWILFTDADIHFSPDALRRAVAHARAHSLDHLAAVPRLAEHGTLLGICVNAFSFVLSLGLRPWLIPNPSSRAHGGVGAFNLVRATTYRKLGGHEPLRMRPDDDIKLGKLMKAGGFSEMLIGKEALSVAWYDSVGAMIRGLTKNAYAGTDYRLWMPLFVALGFVAGWLWPLVAVGIAPAPDRWFYLGTVAVILGLGCAQTRLTGGRWWHGLFLPLGMAVFVFILLRSQAVTLWTRGITWRGTHYPLHELKRNRL